MEILGDGLIKNDSLSNLKEFLINKEFSDAKLIIGNKCFDVHRVVLASQSPFFKALFSTNWNQGDVITLKEEFLQSEIMEDLLSFMYSHVHLTSENIHSLCVAAHFLQIDNFFKTIDDYLCKHISSSNAVSLRSLSCEFGLKSLKKTSSLKIYYYPQEIFLNPLYLEISYEELIVTIQNLLHDELGILDKLRPFLFGQIIDWVQKDEENRFLFFENLMEELEFEQLSFEFLIKNVASNHLVVKSGYCKKILLKVINQKMNY